jgi:hypothetical protein
LIYIAIFTIITTLSTAWIFIGKKHHDNPILFVISGSLIATTGGLAIVTFENMEKIDLLAKLFPDLKISAMFISFTLVAAGGSLIATGFSQKAQLEAEKEKGDRFI